MDAHLLESPEPDRYRFHDLLRVYAADRARTEEAEQRPHGRHHPRCSPGTCTPPKRRPRSSPRSTPGCRWTRPRRGVQPAGHFASLEEAIAWCESERAGLVAATRLAAVPRACTSIAWKLPAAAMSFYYRRSHWGDWVAAHRTGLDSARVDRRPAGAGVDAQQSRHGLRRPAHAGVPSAVSSRRWRCSRTATSAGRGPRPTSPRPMWTWAASPRRWAAAQRSLAIQRQLGNRYLEGVALGILGRACRELGQFD